MPMWLHQTLLLGDGLETILVTILAQHTLSAGKPPSSSGGIWTGSVSTLENKVNLFVYINMTILETNHSHECWFLVLPSHLFPYSTSAVCQILRFIFVSSADQHLYFLLCISIKLHQAWSKSDDCSRPVCRLCIAAVCLWFCPRS